MESQTETRKDRVAFRVVMILALAVIAFRAGMQFAGVMFGCWVVG